MNMVSTLYLAAFLAGPLHAQVCSGGNGGGTDATGNLCNDVATVEPYANGSNTNIAPLRSTAKMNGIPQSSATPGAGRAAKMSDTPTRPPGLVQEVSRFAKAAVSPDAPLKTLKIQTTDASFCSGGANGGMDMNGNECGEAPAVAAIHLAPDGTRRY